jgi:hypothetical protein
MSLSVGEKGPSILSFSKKQNIVSQSSTEAELISLHWGAKSAVAMQKFMTSIGINHSVPNVYQDNTSAISLATGGRPASKASKHINMRYFSIKEYVEHKKILLSHKPTLEMIADILTKPLTGEQFFKLRALLMNE